MNNGNYHPQRYPAVCDLIMLASGSEYIVVKRNQNKI